MLAYTVKDAAQVAKVSESSIRRAIAERQIRAAKIAPRQTYVWWDDVARWLEDRDKRRARPLFGQTNGCVYFMQVGDLIKIGYSTNLPQRTRDLRGTLLASFPGTMADERAMHLRFRMLCHHSEYFHPEPALLEFIQSLLVAA